MSKFKYVEGMIEGIDYVRCPICGRMTRCLSENHTKKVHGLTKKEVLDMFPNYVPCCKQRKISVSEHTKMTWRYESTRNKRVQNIKKALNREEVKEKISKNSKLMWENMHDEISDKIKMALNNEEYRTQKSNEMKAFWNDKESREDRANKIREGIGASETFSKAHSDYMKKRWSDPTVKQKISDNIRKAKIEKGLSGFCTKHFEYKRKNGTSIKVRSSYECKVCEYLDVLNIAYEYEKYSFDYMYENKKHSYIPDFYIPSYDIFIEIKPLYFEENDELTKVKYNSVIDHNKRIIFVDERHIDTLEHFKNQLDTSTTI